MTPETPRDSRARRSAGHGLRRRFVVVLTLIVLIGAAAAVVGSTQGPRLRAVSYSADDLVAKPAQRVILTANQVVDGVTARNVRITPSAPHTVISSGNAITVEFTGPLAYDEQYRITVTGVRAPGQNAASSLSTTIHTGTADVLALEKGATGTEDRIVRRRLAGAGDQVVYAAPGITGFAAVGRSIIVVRDGADHDSRLDLVALGPHGAASTSIPVERISLPSPAGHVSALHVAADGASFGFVYADTSSGRSERVGLYVVDLTGTHMPVPIDRAGDAEAGAAPISVAQWGYVPRSESALVRTADDDLMLVDMSGRVHARRLGSATYLHGFVGAGTTAVVETGAGIHLLDLSDGHRSRLPAPPAVTDPTFRGRIAAITDTSYLRLVGGLRSDGSVDAHLVRVDGDAAHTLATALPADGSITSVCPSPNGQFAAVSTRSDSSALITIVDSRSGALEASISGTTVDWCEALPSGDDVE
jgi:hypothetical protein